MTAKNGRPRPSFPPSRDAAAAGAAASSEEEGSWCGGGGASTPTVNNDPERRHHDHERAADRGRRDYVYTTCGEEKGGLANNRRRWKRRLVAVAVALFAFAVAFAASATLFFFRSSVGRRRHHPAGGGSGAVGSGDAGAAGISNSAGGDSKGDVASTEDDLYREAVTSVLSHVTPVDVLLDDGSHQAAALRWLLADEGGGSEIGGDAVRANPGLLGESDDAFWELVQRYALATFFYATGGPAGNMDGEDGWTVSTGWLSDRGVCDWHGIGCGGGDDDGHYRRADGVTSIVLPWNNLVGVIPDEVKVLHWLEELDLHGNRITNLPARAIGRLVRLTSLRLEDNDMGEDDASVDDGPTGTGRPGRGGAPSVCDELAHVHDLRHFSADCSVMECPCCTACYPLVEFDDAHKDWDHDQDAAATDASSATHVHPAVLSLLTKLSPRDLIEDPTTPQHAAMKWLVEDDVLSPYYSTSGAAAVAAGRYYWTDHHNDFDFEDAAWSSLRLEGQVLERYSLATLYHVASGRNWTGGATVNWLSPDHHVCDWHGVACASASTSGAAPPGGGGDDVDDVDDVPPSLHFWPIACDSRGIRCEGSRSRMSGLHLSGMGLSGNLPEEVRAWTSVEVVDLSDNDLMGAVPYLGDWRAASHIRLSDNRLGGDLDDLALQVGRLENLEILELAGNDFGGRLVPDLLGNLIELDVSNNHVGGSIPSDIGLLTQAQVIRLSGNMLTGTIPEALARLSELVELSLEGNDLGGPVPPSVCDLVDLRSLSADCSGDVPKVDCPCCDVCGGGDVGQPVWSPSVRNESAAVEGGSAADADAHADAMDMGMDPSVFRLLGRVSTESVLRDPSSPQGRAARWLVDDDALGKHSSGPHWPAEGERFDFEGTPLEPMVLERYAMATFYYATRGDGWDNATNWLSRERHVCDWHGIVCETDAASGNVSMSNFHLCDFEGISCDDVRVVKALCMPQNNVHDQLPREIGVFTKIDKINLPKNQISGAIPSFRELSNLSYVNISHNRISGNLKVDIFKNPAKIKTLVINNNMLDGSIPSEIQEMEGLHMLRLAGNNFTGNLPKGIGQLTNLIELDVSNNSLHGPLPSDISQLALLQNLFLSGNSLSGTLPETFVHLRELEKFHVNDNALHGQIDEWITNLRFLRELRLEHNSFSGTLSQRICKLELLPLSADCSGEMPEMDCPCCTECYPLSFEIAADSEGVDTDETNHLEGGSFTFDNNHDAEALSLVTLVSPKHALQDAVSPQQKALAWLGKDSAFEAYLRDDPNSSGLKSQVLERYALAALFFSTGGPPGDAHAGWNISAKWLSGEHVCDWHGVVCKDHPTDDKTIQELRFEQNGLNGRLTGEVFAVLRDLRTVDLSFNHLTGSLPSDIADLVNLKDLSLQMNDLQGTVPPSVCKLDLEMFSTDCLGDRPRIECSCCTNCFYKGPGT